MTRATVLVSTFGSAGDFFPLVPVMQQLQEHDVEVVVAAPRGVSLYARVLGFPTLGMGDGSELDVVADPKIFTRRFGGWSSWRRTVADYVLPALEAHLRGVEAAIERWRPDVVVATGFATAARVAATRAHIPLVTASIYPQHEQAANGAGARHLLPRYRNAVDALLGDGDGATSEVLWGAPADVLLHDPALLGARPGSAPVGFPYWDAVPGRGDDAAAVRSFLRAGPSDETIIVTLGSFIGTAIESTWTQAAAAVQALGVRAVFLGPRGRWAEGEFADRKAILCSPFVPLSEVVDDAAGVVHHGGIGTTFGTLRAGRPAVVCPQAFDQPFNARLVEDVGCGVMSTGDLAADIGRVLQPACRDRATAVAAQLVAPQLAAERAVAAVQAHL